MIKAFAPRMPRGCSWVLLSIVLAGGLPRSIEAQTGAKAAGTAKTKADTAPGAVAPAKEDMKAADEPAEPAEEEEVSKKEPSIEIFKDPRAEEILKKKFGAVGRPKVDNLTKSVQLMAVKESPVDRSTIERFVEGMANELTSQSNLAAMLDISGKPSKKALAIKEATDSLLDVMDRARKVQNQEFLKTYSQVLLAPAPGGKFLPLLNNNLFARIEAMIVLGQTDNPDALKVFTAQLKDPNQTIWVKIWAARGITNVAEEGLRELPTAQAVDAARAVADWLDKEKNLPWPAQLRGLEALGSLRQVNDPAKPSQPEFAAVAMKFLADPESKPEVRAMAGWVLGMIRISPSLTKYNFSLVAFNIGEVAAELGERLNDSLGDNRVRAEYFTSFLIYQIYPALEGKEGARDSGLSHVPANHPNSGQARNYIKQVNDLVKPIVIGSVTLLRAPPGQVPNLKKDLGDRVAALRLFLEKNIPADHHLTPGGPEFPIKNAQVAEAPVGK